MKDIPEELKKLVNESKKTLQELSISFTYKNWKGEVSIRTTVPISIKFEENEYHKPAQWLLHGYDLDKESLRTYALKDISNLKIGARNI